MNKEVIFSARLESLAKNKLYFIFLKFTFFNVYLFLRESTSRGRQEREGDRSSKVSSLLSPESLMKGLNSQTMRSSPELNLDS